MRVKVTWFLRPKQSIATAIARRMDRLGDKDDAQHPRSWGCLKARE